MFFSCAVSVIGMKTTFQNSSQANVGWYVCKASKQNEGTTVLASAAMGGIGGYAGAKAGAAIGTVFGPVGCVLGAAVGDW